MKRLLLVLALLSALAPAFAQQKTEAAWWLGLKADAKEHKNSPSTK